MTTTTKTSTGPKALSWGRYSEDVDRQIAAHTTPAQIEAAYQDYLAGRTQVKTTIVNGAPYTEEYFPIRQARPAGATVAKVVNGASEKQSALIDKLLVEKEFTILTDDLIADIKADWRKTRKLIDMLIAAPRKPYQPPVVVAEVATQATQATRSARLDFSTIPDGNYAIFEGDEVDDVVKFYRVDTNGQWKNVQARGSDTLYPVKGRAGIAVLHKLVAFGLERSQMLFAQKLDRCWMCGRHLTDKVSRDRGMGPDCANK